MMISKSEYLFFFCEGIGSVFDSQVLALLKSINERNIFKKIYLVLGIRGEKDKIEIQKRRISKKIIIIPFRLYPNYPFFKFLIRKNLLKALKYANVNLEESIFHTRGEMMAWHVGNVLDVKYLKNILPDIRGASTEEIKEFSKLGFLKKKLKIYNYECAFKYLTNFSKISVVSNNLKEHLVNNYKINSANIYITPSLAGADFLFDKIHRTKHRNELNLRNDEILVVFSSGGIANWQNNDILKIMAEMGLKILNLSKKKIEHKNIINKFVSYSEMPSYLNAADVAIIWREKSIVNKVASPVKFGEYVCCGLPVIANDSVDMIAEYIKKNSCGLLINSLNDIDINSLNQLKQINRQAIAENGISNFGIDKIIEQYCKIYSTINK
jgi:hypothetical protein